MYAIAKFGSLAVNQNDIFSDLDLLIVCPLSERGVLYEQYTNKGFSVSFFNPEQLEYMQSKGSLFLQHLKRDAEIIIDDGAELRIFLESCEFTKPSEAEISKSVRTIQYIASLPNMPLTNTLKSDFLYCVTRDYLVKKLANENILAFGFKDISSYSVEKFGISEKEFDSFFKLRKIKSSYREIHNDNIHANDINRKWLNTLSNSFNFIIELEKNNIWDFTLINQRTYNSTYEKLRTLEAIYLLARSTGYIHAS